MHASPAVFLDRDGVLIEEAHYLADAAQVRLVPGTAKAVAGLNLAGVSVVVVTNQSGVARGYFPEERVGDIHTRIDELLAAGGAWIDRYYYCPHHPDAAVKEYRVACPCRKPQPGMLHWAAAELGLDLTHCYLIGDKISDLAAGGAAGCKTVLVRTGHGAREDVSAPAPDWNLVRVAADLADAVRYLLPEVLRARLSKSA
jgi:D-glycero-D-manno-heptose 1,7-bisphosphate phosphatase